MKLPCSSWHVTFLRSHSFPSQHVNGRTLFSFYFSVLPCSLAFSRFDCGNCIQYTFRRRCGRRRGSRACLCQKRKTKNAFAEWLVKVEIRPRAPNHEPWHEMPTMIVQKCQPRTTEQSPETNLQLKLLFHIIYIYYRNRMPATVPADHNNRTA